MHGFDIPISDENAFQSAFRQQKTVTDPLGIPIIPLRTNCKEVIRMNWEFWFGLALAAALQMFKEECGTGVLPSGIAYRDLVYPWGSTPTTDYLFSTEGFFIHHDGSGYDRVEKVAKLGEWGADCGHLRVCWQGRQKDRNCGKCEKCLRTKLDFYVNDLPIPASLPGGIYMKDLAKI